MQVVSNRSVVPVGMHVCVHDAERSTTGKFQLTGAKRCIVAWNALRMLLAYYIQKIDFSSRNFNVFEIEIIKLNELNYIEHVKTIFTISHSLMDQRNLMLKSLIYDILNEEPSIDKNQRKNQNQKNAIYNLRERHTCPLTCLLLCIKCLFSVLSKII